MCVVWLLQEKEVVEERLIKMGERDDTLPPEYRPTEEDLKVVSVHHLGPDQNISIKNHLFALKIPQMILMNFAIP